MKKIAGPFDDSVAVSVPGITGEVTYNTKDSKSVNVPDVLKRPKTSTQAPKMSYDTIRGRSIRNVDPGRVADQPPMSSRKTPSPTPSSRNVASSSIGPRARGGNSTSPASTPTPAITSGPSKPASMLGSLVNSFPKKAMLDPFMNAFTDEVLKTAAAAPMAKLKTGATMLGQKVKAMASKVSKRAKGLRAQTKGGSGMKNLVAGKRMAKRAAEGDDGGDESAQDLLTSIMNAAQERINDDDNSQGYNEQQDGGSDDLSYGAGTGLPKTKKKPRVAAPRGAAPRMR